MPTNLPACQRFGRQQNYDSEPRLLCLPIQHKVWFNCWEPSVFSNEEARCRGGISKIYRWPPKCLCGFSLEILESFEGEWRAEFCVAVYLSELRVLRQSKKIH